MDYNAWIEKAINEIETLPNNTLFPLKDLYEGTEWNELDKGCRLSLGRRFKSEVINQHIPNVIYVGKADNNSAQYRKIA